MTTRIATLLTATGLALALLVPSAAHAQAETDLPVGEARGVRLVDDHGGLVLIFSHKSAKLRKRINSRYAWIECTNFGEVFSSVSSGNLDVPRRGRRVRTGFGVDGADYCEFFLRAHTVKRHGSRHRVPRRVLFSIPLTQAGAVHLDEKSKAGVLWNVSLLAAFFKDEQKLGGHPSFAQLVREYPKLARVVVPLSTPDATPPPKRVGYYSDGREHIALAILSASGKRLFIEASAGDVLSTNVAAYLFDD